MTSKTPLLCWGAQSRRACNSKWANCMSFLFVCFLCTMDSSTKIYSHHKNTMFNSSCMAHNQRISIIWTLVVAEESTIFPCLRIVVDHSLSKSSKANLTKDVKNIWKHLSTCLYLLHHIHEELESWISMSTREAFEIDLSMVYTLHILWHQPYISTSLSMKSSWVPFKGICQCQMSNSKNSINSKSIFMKEKVEEFNNW